jgi:hypothetical protein
VRPTGLSGGPHGIGGKSGVHVRGACGRMSGRNTKALEGYITKLGKVPYKNRII